MSFSLLQAITPTETSLFLKSSAFHHRVDKQRVDAFKNSLTNHFAHLINREFSVIDADADGELNLPEFLAAAPRLGMNVFDAHAFFGDLDADGNGAISKSEIRAYLEHSGDCGSISPLLDVKVPSSALNVQEVLNCVALDVHEPRTAVSKLRFLNNSTFISVVIIFEIDR